MNRRAAVAIALALLLTGSTSVSAQRGDPSTPGGEAPTANGPRGIPSLIPGTDAPTPNYEAYTGRPEAMNCLDAGTQANAQAILRADPSDPLQLDSDRNGIACEINPAPRDSAPVRR
jgi:hypothetical protein